MVNMQDVVSFGLVGLCSLLVSTVTSVADARTVPGAAALTNIPGEQGYLDIEGAAVKNVSSFEAGVTISLPVDSFDKNYTPSISVVMDSWGACRSVGVRSDNGWIWTQGWKSNSASSNELTELALGNTWVPANGTMIVECWVEPTQSINRVKY